MDFLINFIESLTFNEILGNLVFIAAGTVMVLIGLIHEKKKILEVQCLQFFLMAISHGLVGGLGGAISCIVSIARNLVVFKKGKLSKGIKIFFVVIMAAFSIPTISFDPITWIPVVATGIFTWYIDCEDVIKFKWVILGTVIMWLVYDFSHNNFVASAFDVFTVISTLYGIVKMKKYRKASEE